MVAPAVGAAIVSGVASIAGGMTSSNTSKELQDDAQEFNSAEALKNREWQTDANEKAMYFSHEQARIQREYETEMSNSAYQRSVEDLRKAGLNPALAYMHGGSSTPSVSAPSGTTSSGSSASISPNTTSGPALQRGIENAINSAFTSVSMKKELEKKDSEIGVNNGIKAVQLSQAEVNQATAESTRLDVAKKIADLPYSQNMSKVKNNPLLIYLKAIGDSAGPAAGAIRDITLPLKLKWGK